MLAAAEDAGRGSETASRRRSAAWLLPVLLMPPFVATVMGRNSGPFMLLLPHLLLPAAQAAAVQRRVEHTGMKLVMKSPHL